MVQNANLKDNTYSTSIGSYSSFFSSEINTVDVCKKNDLRNAQSEVSLLDDSTWYKRIKICKSFERIEIVNGRREKTAMNFIDDFEKFVEGGISFSIVACG
ncbi:hypothetical protein P9112_010159 [Eukaryota sp. TZLM1-RC]